MTRTQKVLSALLFVFALSGCTQAITEGKVIDKVHEPARTWTQLMPISTGKITVMIPFVHHDDEDFVIVIHGPNDKGHILTRRVYLTKADWAAVAIGEHYSVSDHLRRTAFNDQHTRRRQ